MLEIVLLWNFSLPCVWWKYKAEKKQYRSFLGDVEYNFLSQLVSEPNGRDAWLDLLFRNKEGLEGDLMVGVSPEQSNHEMTKFSILGEIW